MLALVPKVAQVTMVTINMVLMVKMVTIVRKIRITHPRATVVIILTAAIHP